MEIEPKNLEIWGSLAWSLYSNHDFDSANVAFKTQITLNPKSISGYYGLGQVYAHYQTQDVAKAKEYFAIALTLNPSKAQKDYMDKYMNEH